MTYPRLAFALGAFVSVQMNLNAQAPAVRDSAGIRIVENPARLSFPINLKIGPTPTFDVGGLHDDNPDAEFDSKQGYLRGVRLSNGGLVAIDVNKVKYFDAAGKLVKVAGRDGDGPGEFRYLTAICRTRGDTIVVADRARLGVLDKNGTFIRHLPSTPRYSPFDGCFGDGTLILSSSVRNSPMPGQTTMVLWRARLAGAAVDSLGTLVGTNLDLITQHQVTFAASGNLLHVGDGSKREIAVYEIAGAELKPVMSIRSADVPDPISAAEAEEGMARTIPNSVSASERKARMDRMKAAPRAATWPLIGRIHVDPLGNLWVADYDRTWRGPTGYSKFDANGRLVGRLMTPARTTSASRIEVIGFGVNDILVRRRDDDGASHLTVYPIVPAR
jgi:hypothetical protein